MTNAVNKVIRIQVETTEGAQEIVEFTSPGRSISELLTLAKFRTEDIKPDQKHPQWTRILISIQKDSSQTETITEMLQRISPEQK